MKSIEDIRASLIVRFPLMTKTLLSLPFEDKKVDTLETDGKVVKYNPDFFYAYKPTVQEYFMMHEVAHVFLGHHLRIHPEMDFEDANLAMDYAVNDLLHDAKFHLPEGVAYKYKYRGLAFEEIYDLVHVDKNENFNAQSNGIVKPSPDLSEDGEGSGEGIDCDDQLPSSQNTEAKRQELIDQHNQGMQEALQSAMMMGALSKELQDLFKKLLKPQINWEDAFAELLIKATDREDYTFSRPNKRYDSDFIMPSLYSEKAHNPFIVIDSSGSVGRELKAKLASDVMRLIEDIQPDEVTVVSCDAQMHLSSMQKFENGDTPDKINIVGGGGTDFRPPFEYLEKIGEEPDVLVYLTDGYCSRFPKAPSYPVIWCVWQDRHPFNPPFGEVIVISEGK